MNILREAQHKRNEKDAAKPSSINQIYSTNLYSKGEKQEDNPFYALERLYETADKWKRDREIKNEKFLQK